ncbi:MAG: hypothetical protein ACYC2H_12995 [Thermoplasmatota archaeon]
MDPAEPVACPLCGAWLRERPDALGRDLRDLALHLEMACPARTG